MVNVLVAWIGNTDLRIASGSEEGSGPIDRALDARPFEEAWLLSNYDPKIGADYIAWLRPKTKVKITFRQATLRTPTHLGDIYQAVTATLTELLERVPGARLTFHTSPGTPAMAAVWIILAKSRYGAELIESSRERGVRTLEAPFELAAEFVAQRVRAFDEALDRVGDGLLPEHPAFRDIIHRSAPMKALLDRASRAAPLNAPVLLEGESGTGKELLARALHAASPRSQGPFIAINCGALPRDLVPSMLFGHEKGAFTGAVRARRGAFGDAAGGTLFLDEIGELPLDQQVNLLRALQEKKIMPVGASKEVAVDVRILAATHRDLAAEVRAGRFREDLYFRLAILVLRIPPLRDRHGDISLLVDALLPRMTRQLGASDKRLSAGARKLMLRHAWPGNVREVEGVLARAIAWSRGPVISEEEMREALLVRDDAAGSGILGRQIGEGFVLEDLLAEVASHYLRRGLEEGGGVKKRAASLLGFAHYQTFDLWYRRYIGDA